MKAKRDPGSIQEPESNREPESNSGSLSLDAQEPEPRFF